MLEPLFVSGWGGVGRVPHCCWNVDQDQEDQFQEPPSLQPRNILHCYPCVHCWKQKTPLFLSSLAGSSIYQGKLVGCISCKGCKWTTITCVFFQHLSPVWPDCNLCLVSVLTSAEFLEFLIVRMSTLNEKAHHLLGSYSDHWMQSAEKFNFLPLSYRWRQWVAWRARHLKTIARSAHSYLWWFYGATIIVGDFCQICHCTPCQMAGRKHSQTLAR